MSVEFKIDGKTIIAENGETILQAAARNGIAIPSLCRNQKISHTTSCFVCVVKDCKTGRFLPSCSACPANGQEIESDTAEVFDMRQTALNLLLSEHTGDCEAPCTVACPAHAAVEEYVQAGKKGDFLESLKIIKKRIPLPMTIGRVCPRFCEKNCRKNITGSPVAINDFKRLAADMYYDSYMEDIAPEVTVVTPQIERGGIQNHVLVDAVVEDVAVAPVEVITGEVKNQNIDNNIPSAYENIDASLTSVFSFPDEEAVVDNELIQQKAKIAELLPEDSSIKMEVSVKNDKITSFNEQTPLASVVENIEVEQTEILDLSSQISVEETQVSETADIEPEFAVANVVEEINVVDFIEEKNSSVTDIANSTVSSFVAGENISQTSRANVTNSVNDNFKDIYNKGLTRDVAEQIKVNITQSAIKGVDKIEIKLNPADLGQLEIKMQIGKDGRLQTHIIASNAETLELLQKDLSGLKDAFNNAGYQTDEGSFSFSYRGEEQNNNNEREQLRNFIGEVIAQDIAEELAANNDYVGIDGVNIRV